MRCKWAQTLLSLSQNTKPALVGFAFQGFAL